MFAKGHKRVKSNCTLETKKNCANLKCKDTRFLCRFPLEMSGKIRGPTLTNFVDELTLGSFFFNRAEKYKDQICQVRKLLPKSCQILRVKQNHTDRWHLG
jgi:hypothetical protein